MESNLILKTITTKKGSQAIIRTVSKDDLDDMLSYVNNLIDEDTYLLLSGTHLNREEESKYLDDSLTKLNTGKKIHLVVTVDGKFAGSCEARIMDKRKSHIGEVGISIAKKYREEGIGAEILKTLISECRKTGLRLLYLHCFENNERAIHLYKKIGFIPAGVVPGVYAYKGEYIGEITMYLPLV